MICREKYDLIRKNKSRRIKIVKKYERKVYSTRGKEGRRKGIGYILGVNTEQ